MKVAGQSVLVEVFLPKSRPKYANLTILHKMRVLGSDGRQHYGCQGMIILDTPYKVRVQLFLVCHILSLLWYLTHTFFVSERESLLDRPWEIKGRNNKGWYTEPSKDGPWMEDNIIQYNTLEEGAPLGCHVGLEIMSRVEHGARVANSRKSYIKDGYMDTL